ncbi:MAG: ABC transporter ATP-binding protein [Ancalomicrobiaceae bacterium]|nr:ABC transporter ATP-binding protein [Ancalomicrobiaceae bacterium]
MAEPLIEVDGLTVRFPTADGGWSTVVDGVRFAAGYERLAIVGESGSGKSLTARAILGLVPAPGQVTAERLHLAGRDLRNLTPSAWERVRGAEIGLVLQDPRFALNPLHRVGRQVEEALVLHTSLGRAERRERALDMLDAVGLERPRDVYHLFPGQLSGGMGQRVMIAAMLVARPKLLIADEPTSALDENLRRQILQLIADLAERHHMGLILISHDLQQVADFADEVIVMFRGRIVDRRGARDLAHSSNPYTAMLWNCRPSAATYGTRLPTLAAAEREALDDRGA